MRLSIRGKILFNNINHRVAQYRGELKTALPYAKRVVELYESHPAILEDDKLVYLRNVASLAHFQFMEFGIDKAIPALTKIRNAKVSTPQERVFRFRRVYMYYMVMLVDTGDAASAEFLEEFHTELGRLKRELPASVQLYAYYLLTFYYHIQGEHSLALRSINEFLNHPRSNVSTSLQAAARIYNLVIHFELGNYDLVEYNLKSASRFIYKMERMGKYERRILSFFSRAINANSKTAILDEMIEFREDLDEIFQDPFEEKATDFFKILEWLDSKIEEIRFAEAVQRTAKFTIGQGIRM